MGEKYGYGFDAWDSEEESLSDAEIADTMSFADTMCQLFGSNHQGLDDWEREHFKLIAKHKLSWKQYRPLHMRHVVKKYGIDVTDEQIDLMFEKA